MNGNQLIEVLEHLTPEERIKEVWLEVYVYHVELNGVTIDANQQRLVLS